MKSDHIFLGWHRCISHDVRIQSWLVRRQKALYEALSCIPGGKDVCQYIKQRGWLDLGPQLKAVKTTPLRLAHLKHYQAVALFVNKKRLPYNHNQVTPPPLRYIFALGLVDHRLQVRELRIHSPPMWPQQDSMETTWPKSFTFCDQSMCESWLKEMIRIHYGAEVNIQMTIGKLIHHRMSDTVPYGINAAKEPQEYPRFDVEGKKMPRFLHLMRSPVEVVMLHSHVSVFHYDTEYGVQVQVFGKFKIQQLKMRKSIFDQPLFIEDSDD